MDTDPQRTRPLALEPIASTSDGDAPTKRQLRITIADEFVAEAAQEYQDGHIDQALWSRASLAGSDEALVVAGYLRARATALRMERRNRQTDARPHDAARHERPSPPRSDAESTTVATPRRWTKRPVVLAAAAVALTVVVALGLMIAAQRHVETAGQPDASPVRSSNGSPTTAAPAQQQQALPDSTASAGRSEDLAALETKVRQFKDAANWNVLVLYASEWTRKEPKNPAAWSDLGVGYANLHQFDDALTAATKAVQLAPADALHWRNLAQVNLALERLPDAATAFDNALLANPGDVGALCGALAVAQKQGRSKDADAMSARVKTINGSCPDIDNVEKAVAVHPAARKSQASNGR